MGSSNNYSIKLGIKLDESALANINSELNNKLKNKNVNISIDAKNLEQIKDLLNNIYLKTIDSNWPSQITAMDNLKSGAFYRQYANTNPLVTYKTEGFELFNNMFLNIAKQSIASYINVKPIVNTDESKLEIKVEDKENNN